ncbi:hypothetical protein GDO81_021895 [Engystomops pustulosus]|uniref:Uncharacterized protein n=1 Tax=Engystomops pustulosus TaxID=76066 RepID=A0AAV6ZNS2_ENGPU|nr:hypothetical protein GDO81_021895 [Engystomops pustulosus]
MPCTGKQEKNSKCCENGEKTHLRRFFVGLDFTAFTVHPKLHVYFILLVGTIMGIPYLYRHYNVFIHLQKLKHPLQKIFGGFCHLLAPITFSYFSRFHCYHF